VFPLVRVDGAMWTVIGSRTERLARWLGLDRTAVPLGRPDAAEAVHWYAIWQGDAFAE
jgi:hypothetical protein